MMKIAFSSFRLPFGTPSPQGSQPVADKNAETSPPVQPAAPGPLSVGSSATSSQAIGIPTKPPSQSTSPACSPSPSAPIGIPLGGARKPAGDGAEVAAEDFRINGAKDFSKVSRGNKREAFALVTNAFTVLRPNPPPVTTNFAWQMTPLSHSDSDVDAARRTPSPEPGSKAELSSSVSSTGSDSSSSISMLHRSGSDGLPHRLETSDGSGSLHRFRASSSGAVELPCGGTISMSQLMKDEASTEEGIRRIKRLALLIAASDSESCRSICCCCCLTSCANSCSLELLCFFDNVATRQVIVFLFAWQY
eukprot:TRINITY_DN1986_c0_g1_i2.p1 TRINITY_DN1986_c0_g1~~TRINITY_DN1986_c0_g1_i2.p1  ORF type:complete len:306 (+),score=78.06 TRINITY_DN1986_c0_g1_i2:156-1073(+)